VRLVGLYANLNQLAEHLVSGWIASMPQSSSRVTKGLSVV